VTSILSWFTWDRRCFITWKEEASSAVVVMVHRTHRTSCHDLSTVVVCSNFCHTDLATSGGRAAASTVVLQRIIFTLLQQWMYVVQLLEWCIRFSIFTLLREVEGTNFPLPSTPYTTMSSLLMVIQRTFHFSQFLALIFLTLCIAFSCLPSMF
jgi:hypothetical protein